MSECLSSPWSYSRVIFNHYHRLEYPNRLFSAEQAVFSVIRFPVALISAELDFQVHSIFRTQHRSNSCAENQHLGGNQKLVWTTAFFYTIKVFCMEACFVLQTLGKLTLKVHSSQIIHHLWHLIVVLQRPWT